MQPRTLAQAYEQAKLQEQTITAMMKRSKQIFRSQRGTNFQGSYRGVGSATSGRGLDATRSQFKLTVEKTFPNWQLFEHRIATGLCFKYEDKYSLGHLCKQQIVNIIYVSLEITEVCDETNLQEMEEEEWMKNEEKEETGLSVHALSAENTQDTMKIQGGFKDKTLSIFVDMRSTLVL